jgi:uncharacterized protein YndB with AHSA1/START domain
MTDSVDRSHLTLHGDALGDAPGSGVRAVTREVVIAASVDSVWKALTDAEELTRWFPPLARVDPGVGGSVWRAWPSGEEIEERIECWEPNAHLRTLGLVNAWKGITTDYHLTSRGGSTVLRVVSSGFGADASWDALYDAFGGGWDFELLGLRHYLECHAGVPRNMVFVRSSRSMSAAESWRRLVGPGGWFGERGLTDSTRDARYSVGLTTGQTLSGVMYLWQPPRQFAATVDQFNNAYVRLDTRCIGDTGTPWISLSTYGIPLDQVRALEGTWQATLDASMDR